MMSNTDKTTGEKHVMWLLKETKFPMVDIVDWWIRHETLFRARTGRTKLADLFLEIAVYRQTLLEFVKLLEETPQEVRAIKILDNTITFDGVKIHPFLVNAAGAASMPQCSILMIIDKGEFRGL